MEMLRVEKVILIQEVEGVLEELKALTASSPTGSFGPDVLLAYEINSLEEALYKARDDNGTSSLQQCLIEGKHLLSKLRQTGGHV